MLSVAQAQATILEATCPLPARATALTPAALGLVLGEDVVSDIDSPPHDKALMDGYAVRLADVPGGRGELEVIEEITAGHIPTRPLGPGQAARIMTGAPIPAGADVVVQVERTQPGEGNRVRIEDRPPRAGQNILTRGREMRPGQVVMPAGRVLHPQDFGVLATIGRVTPRLIPRPGVAILSTGDEVVEPSQVPGPGQIRNSNGPMLAAQAARAGALPRFLGIARDDVDELRAIVRQGLEDDVLVLSGGVSAGKLDLVPGVLQELGVEQHFHKVAMKPGKPAFFGTRERPDGKTLVFGLPGNPVSSFVCFELFVRPALRKFRGLADTGPRVVQATLAEDFPYRTDRPTYHPALLSPGPDGWKVQIVPWFGSPDLLGLTRGNALAVLPPGDHEHKVGERLPVIVLEEQGPGQK
jgi:molybdopterin molybdotransferase